MFLSRQLGVHYTNHFTGFVVLGIASLFWTIWLRIQENKRLLILVFGVLILTINVVITMTLIQAYNNLISFLFAKNNPPLMRKDYDEFVSLINNLREITSAKQAIYIAAFSRTLNDSLLGAAEEQLYGKENKEFLILYTPDIDSRDSYPIREILQAQYIVVANPFQHHLPAKEQEIVKIVMDAFTENWEIAQDFQRLQQQFRLDNNVIVNIYKRTRPTSVETALNTLKLLQERIQPKPGGESNWIALDKQNKATLWFNKHGTINLKTIFKEEPVTFIYFGSISDSEFVNISANTQSTKCLGFTKFSLNLKLLNKTGDVVETQNVTYFAQNPIDFPLSIQKQGKEAAYLLLEFQGQNKSNENSYCSVYIKNIAVKNAKE